jgi:hypothetical protein
VAVYAFIERVDEVPLAHARDVNEPQLPEYSCSLTPAVLKLDPMLLSEIVGKPDCATKRNHTSPPGVPAQPELTAGEEAVAPESVAEVLEQEEAVVSSCDEAHASLAGACSSVMVYPLLLVVGLDVTYTLA